MDNPLTDAIDRLRERGTDFTRAFSLLANDRAMAIKAGKLMEWNALMQRGSMLRDTISSITRGVDYAGQTLRSVFGLSGIQSMAALPVVGLAAVLAAIAGVTYFTTEAYRLHAALQSGVKAETLFAVQPPTLESASNMVKWLVIGGVVLYFLRPTAKD